MAKIALPGSFFQPEVSTAGFKLAVATGIVLDGTTATVTSASHLMAAGNYVTFSGCTGVTGVNNATWGPVNITSSSVYTFPCSLSGSVTGSPVQEKLYFMPAGVWDCILGANGQLEYCPNNQWGKNYPGSSSGSDSTWRVLIAASAGGRFETDGYSIRFRENGTTATSYFSQQT